MNIRTVSFDAGELGRIEFDVDPFKRILACFVHAEHVDIVTMSELITLVGGESKIINRAFDTDYQSPRVDLNSDEKLAVMIALQAKIDQCQKYVDDIDSARSPEAKDQRQFWLDAVNTYASAHNKMTKYCSIKISRGPESV